MKRRKPPARRNPVARVVKTLAAKTVPDRRRKKLTRAEKREVKEEMEEK